MLRVKYYTVEPPLIDYPFNQYITVASFIFYLVLLYQSRSFVESHRRHLPYSCSSCAAQVPESIEVVIDIRTPPSVREQQFYSMMQQWCDLVGPGVSYTVEYLRFTETHPDAVIDPTCASHLGTVYGVSYLPMQYTEYECTSLRTPQMVLYCNILYCPVYCTQVLYFHYTCKVYCTYIRIHGTRE